MIFVWLILIFAKNSKRFSAVGGSVCHDGQVDAFLQERQLGFDEGREDFMVLGLALVDFIEDEFFLRTLTIRVVLVSPALEVEL